MILHQQLLHPTTGPRHPWLALHVASLTLALCKQRFETIHIHPITLPRGPFTTAKPIRLKEALHQIGIDIQALLPTTTIQTHAEEPSPIPNPQSQIPLSILVNSLDGTTPGILHLADPIALYLADPETSILHPATVASSQQDISAEGWAYWWEDAQRAFHKQTIAFYQACKLPIPEAIQSAADLY
jgi:hypothetical protein